MYRSFFIVTGTACVLYYILLTILSGFHVYFNFIWLGMGMLLIGLSFIHRPALKKTFTIFLLLISIAVIGAVSPIIMASAQEEPADTQYLLIPGAAVNADYSPSNVLYHRLQAAKDYYNTHPNVIIIVSGAQGEDERISEALCMRDWLLERGVDEQHIIMDEQAQNTSQNITYAKEIMKDPDLKLTIVTSNFHMYRCLRLAEINGFTNVTGISSYTIPALLPNYYIREAAASFKDFYL